MRQVIRTIVEDSGSLVQECGDGESATRLYQQVHPAWVLMDIEMPGMDGLSAAREIRRFDPDARVVIVSEHVDDGYRRAAREAGACGFVAKDNLMVLSDMLAGSNHTVETDPEVTGESNDA